MDQTKAFQERIEIFDDAVRMKKRPKRVPLSQTMPFGGIMILDTL